jgi:hypothetical protein
MEVVQNAYNIRKENSKGNNTISETSVKRNLEKKRYGMMWAGLNWFGIILSRSAVNREMNL